MRKIECFKIRLLAGDVSQAWNVKQLHIICDIYFDRHPLNLNPVVIVADPFLFVHHDRLFLFYEEKRNYSNGVLRMTSTKDLMEWTDAVTVLEEPFHLSYPFVFEDEESVYMIPETGAVGDIRLYKADDDTLEHFSFFRTLVSKDVIDGEVGYADSSVYKREGIYYLMSSIERSHVNYTYLFTASSLVGPYQEHVCSPLCCSAKIGRNAGCLLTDSNGRLLRVAQDCEDRYGDNVHLLQVDEMSKDAYREHLVKENLIPTDIPFYCEGGHQYNFVFFHGKCIIATDAKEYHTYSCYRMVHKIGLVLHQLFKKLLPF